MDARTILEEVYVEYLACSAGVVMATGLARLSGRTLANYLWASLCTCVRWAPLHLKTRLNHLALKNKIRFAAQQAALTAFRKLSTA